MNKENAVSPIDYNQWTVKQLREFCQKNNIKLPSKAKKKDIVDLIQVVASHPEFVDRTQEEEERML